MVDGVPPLTGVRSSALSRAALTGVVRTMVLLGALALGGCTTNVTPSPEAVITTPTTSTIPTTPVPRPTPIELKSVCPNPVVLQLNRPVDVWSLPLVGVTAVDGRTGASAYRAAMIDPLSALPLGLDIEIRTAATIGNGSVLAAMRSDPTILLGTVSTEELLAAEPSIKAVFAPWERNDLALTWATSLGAKTAAGLPPGSSTSPLPAGTNPAAPDYLKKSGIFTAAKIAVRTTVRQVENAVTTVPAPPAQLDWAQLFTNPFVTQNANLTVQLVDELGWEPYPFVMVASDATFARYDQCLRGLIPVLQGGAVRVGREPERLAANLATISAKLGSPVDVATVVVTINVATTLGILGNGADSTLGDVAAARLAQFTRAISVAAGDKPEEFPVLERALRAKVEGRFIDPLIGRS